MEESQHLWTNTVILRVLVPFILLPPIAIEYAQVCFVTYNQEQTLSCCQGLSLHRKSAERFLLQPIY